MQPSPIDAVRDMYDQTADAYAQMMDAEIALPVYADVLGRLQRRIAHSAGPLLDTACGSGHMLALFRERFDPHRPLMGVDLSPGMVAIAAARLGANAQLVVGDMRELAAVESGSCAALLNFFALHHLSSEGVRQALAQWHRVLAPGSQLVVAAWEGSGAIDYGSESEIVALRYRDEDLAAWAQAAGFKVQRCTVEPVEDFPMDAVYLEAGK